MKRNVKEIWNDYKKKRTIKRIITVVIVPIPVIVASVLLNKYLDKKNNELLNTLEDI